MAGGGGKYDHAHPSIVEQIATAGSAGARLALLKPLAFLHAEKTGGTSFVQVLAYFAELWEGCQWASKIASDPEHWAYSEQIAMDCSDVWSPVYPLSSECPALWDWDNLDPKTHPLNHAGLDFRYDINKGHVVSWFRQPEQRIISGYFANTHSYPPILPDPSQLEYAIYVQGCQSKMLARSMTCDNANVSVCADGIPPTSEETSRALRRLREGVAFVGITEQWDLSICLFHAKFGGDCLSTDFLNMHPGKNITGSVYDTSELEGFIDHADRLVYREALSIFQDDLAKFGATEARCATSCWSHESEMR